MLRQSCIDAQGAPPHVSIRRIERMLIFRKETDDKYELNRGDRRLTHKDLLKAAAEWKTNQRITGGTHECVEDRHVFGLPRQLKLSWSTVGQSAKRGERIPDGRIQGTLVRTGLAA